MLIFAVSYFFMEKLSKFFDVLAGRFYVLGIYNELLSFNPKHRVSEFSRRTYYDPRVIGNVNFVTHPAGELLGNCCISTHSASITSVFSYVNINHNFRLDVYALACGRGAFQYSVNFLLTYFYIVIMSHHYLNNYGAL